MSEKNDMELVREYVQAGSDAAFADLVQRHINLVYSVALRFTGNPADAEDVAQAVFIILAKKAASLRADTVLAGWLYETTRLSARQWLRTRTRREHHEQEASMQPTPESPNADPLWLQLKPLLEDAMARLNQKERTLLALRFFENRTGAESAAMLGIGEWAARKRAARALEKLRRYFANHGVNSTTAIIERTISVNSIQVAPATLAKTVATVAVAKGVASSASTLTLVKGALKVMAWTKAKTAIVAAAAAALVVAGGGGYLALARNAHPKQPGRMTLPAGPLTPEVSFGRSHGIILAPDGSLWSWGENDLGWPALGLGDVKNTAYLNRIGSDTDWTAISAGQSHNLALKSDGSIWGWGENLYDELGTHPAYLRPRGRVGTENSAVNSPTPVKSALGTGWKEIAAGSDASFGIKTDGTLWAWGLNNFGQLGVGGFSNQPAPVQIGSATWTKVRASYVNGAGIQTDGSLWIWGGGPTTGNTISRSTTNYLSPVRVSDNTNWQEVAVGDNVVFALNADGTIWAWGQGASLYTGVKHSEASLTQIGNDSDWSRISCRSRFLVIAKKDGSLWTMSSPEWGKPAKLAQIDLKRNIVAFAGGGGLGVALTSDGEVWTWGKTIGEDVMRFEGSGTNAHTIDPKFHVFDKPWQLSNRERP
jgi:RNA polymerase sigma factor (sigma-70 family)